VEKNEKRDHISGCSRCFEQKEKNATILRIESGKLDLLIVIELLCSLGFIYEVLD